MSHSPAKHAVGIDIGGTGIKGGLVDLSTGELIGDRIKIATPVGGKPADILTVVADIIERIDAAPKSRLGIAFPAIVKHGFTASAANVSPEWIGLDAHRLFRDGLGRHLTFLNDADAAALAEARFGAARGRSGAIRADHRHHVRHRHRVRLTL